MPLRPEDLDFMQSYLSGAPREDLQKRLDGMYGPVTPEMQQQAFGGPDARTAQNMSVDPAMSVDPGVGPTVASVEAAQRAAPPAPQPVAVDAGGMSGGGPNMSVAPEPTMSVVTPEMRAQMNAETEARLSGAGQPAPAERPFDPVGRYLQRDTLEQMRGSRGQVVPGGEQLAGRTLTRELHGQLSPETGEALEDASIDAQGMAVGQAESAAQQLEKQARAQGQQAQRARSELASYKRNTVAKEAEYDIRRAELDDMKEQVQREPITFFSGDETAHGVTKGIGLFMLGILGGPRAMMQAINTSIDQKMKERGQAISLLDDQLDRFKAGIPNPEAQALYVRSLGMDAAAAEADRMANMAKAEDVRQRGFAAAEMMRMEALKARAAAETASRGKEEIKTANVAPKVVGGRRGKTIAEIGKERGWTSEQVLENLYTGERNNAGTPRDKDALALAKDEMGRRVELPGMKTTLWSPREQDAKEIQGNLVAQMSLEHSLDRIAEMVSTPGRKIDPSTWKKIQAEVSKNLVSVAKQGGQGAVGDAEAERLGVLAGSVANEWSSPESVSTEVLQHLKQMLADNRANTLGTLYTQPYGAGVGANIPRYAPGNSAAGEPGLKFTEFK